MLTTIIIIVLSIIIIKCFGPLLLDLVKGLFSLLSLPFAIVGGFLAFLIEAGVFLGLLWLLMMFFGE